jgi:hypothetical protein
MAYRQAGQQDSSGTLGSGGAEKTSRMGYSVLPELEVPRLVIINVKSSWGGGNSMFISNKAKLKSQVQITQYQLWTISRFQS